MTWWLFCGCKTWVEASGCPNNISDKRLFVHQDNAPASGQRFEFDSTSGQRNCWYVPEDPPTCLPQSGIYTIDPDALFSDCAACESGVAVGSGTFVGGGGSTPNTGGGGIDDGGGDTSVGDPDVENGQCGVLMTLCPDHQIFPNAPDNLYVLCDNLPDVAKVYSVLGYCYEIDPADAQVDPVPADSFIVDINKNGGFDDCEDCTMGVPFTVCSGEVDDPPENRRWTRKPDLPSGTIGFMRDGKCYELDPTDDLELLPLVRRLETPINQFDDCTGCPEGIPYVLCPGQTVPQEDYWAKSTYLTGLSGTIIQKIGTHCYSLDTEATPQKIPVGVYLRIPQDVCESCATCLCGGCPPTSGSLGYKATPCGSQDQTNIRNIWLLGDPPANEVVFKDNDVCYFINPSQTKREIPFGTHIVEQLNVFNNCVECITDDGGDDGGDDPNIIIQPPPGWPPLPEDRYLQLRECETNDLTNFWVREVHLCAVFGVAPCDLEGFVVHLTSTDEWYILENPQNSHNGITVTNFVDQVVTACPSDPCDCQDAAAPCAQPDATTTGNTVPGSPNGCNNSNLEGAYVCNFISETAFLCRWQWNRVVGGSTWSINIFYNKNTEIWDGNFLLNAGGPTIQLYTIETIGIACVNGTLTGSVQWQRFACNASVDARPITVFG